MNKKSGPRILTADEKSLLLEISTGYKDLSTFSFFNKSDSELIVDWPDLGPLIYALIDDNIAFAKNLYLEHFKSLAHQLYEEKSAYESYGENCVMKYWSESTLISQIVLELTERRWNLDSMARILNEFDCSSAALIRLKNPALTRAYLPLRKSDQIFQYGDSMFRILVKNVDTENLKLFLARIPSHFPNSYLMFEEPINNIRKLHAHEAGRVFLNTFLQSNIYTFEYILHLEQVLMRAKRENLEIFFEYDFRLFIKSQTCVDIMASVFCNRDLDVLAMLKTMKIDLNVRGSCHRAPLHLVVDYVDRPMIENIKFLLSRGADPNAIDGFKRTPLIEALHYISDNDENADYEESIKELLIWGADLLHNYKNNDKIRWKTFFCIESYDLRNDSRFYSNLINLLLAQLAICEMLGLSVEKPMEDYKVLQRERYADNVYYDICKEQLELLKTHKFRDVREFYGQKFTMFALLSQRAEHMVRHIKDDDTNEIATFMEKYKREKLLIPFYYETLERHIEFMNRISALIDATKCVLSKCMGIADMNHLVINKIIDYIPTCDFLMQNNE